MIHHYQVVQVQPPIGGYFYALTRAAMQTSLERFLNQLCGEFSNQQQALDNPPFFAHIFIRYRPIEHLKPGSILLEQSYALNPKIPYRLRMIRAEESATGAIKLWNHKFKNPELFATATTELKQRQKINESDLIRMDNCHYQVVEKIDGYHGQIEPGCHCMVRRDGKNTYLVSSFHLQGDKLSTLDQGFDPQTHERCWGAIAGKFQFVRTTSWEANWIEDGIRFSE